MKPISQIDTTVDARAPKVEVTSAEDAPETVLDLRRPDPVAAVAAGELVQALAERPQQPAHLITVLGRTLVHEIQLLRTTIGIGRDVNQDLVIDDQSVSRKHCQLCYEQGSYVLRDLGTSNGTTLNGRATITENLVPGDEIGVGRYVVVFCPTQRQINKLECRVNAVLRPTAPAAATSYLSFSDIDNVRQAVSSEREAHLLRVGQHGEFGKRFVLAGATSVLGKRRLADIPLRGALVAARHAEILRRGNDFVIRRRGTWRRVFVNGRAVDEHQLRDRDQIRIGRTTFQFFEAAR